jgi:ketosteroid isomerase-like protein
MRVPPLVVLVGALAVLTPWAGAQTPDPGAAALGESVRAYMAAIDAGDLDGQMAFWSDDPAVTSAIMGEVWAGRTGIRGRSAEYVPVSKLVRNELGATSVLPLGPDAAVSVTPYRPIRRDPGDARLAPFELDSMLTLVWRRLPAGWRIVHEHVSVKVTPPG